MAKVRLNGWGKLIPVIITIVLITIAGVKAAAVFGERQKVLKTEGCNIARKAEKDILVMQNNIKHIRGTTDKILEKMESK